MRWRCSARRTRAAMKRCTCRRLRRSEEPPRDDPDHPGIVHYLIHSYDDPVHAPLGLRAARKYSAIAPERTTRASHDVAHLSRRRNVGRRRGGERAGHRGCGRARARGRVGFPAACGHAEHVARCTAICSRGARRLRGASSTAVASWRRRPAALEIGSPDQDPLDPDNIPAASYVQMWAGYVIDTGGFVGPAMQDEIALGTLAGARVTRAFVHALAASRADDSKRLHESIEGFRKRAWRAGGCARVTRIGGG